jgi:hypothetical protein
MSGVTVAIRELWKARKAGPEPPPSRPSHSPGGGVKEDFEKRTDSGYLESLRGLCI